MSENNLDSAGNGEISKADVYRELYVEMKRHKEYQLIISSWCTTVLIAIMGAILLSDEKKMMFLLLQSVPAKISVSFLVILIGLVGAQAVKYSDQQYMKLRKFTDEELEPKWKNIKSIARIEGEIRILPHQMIMLVHLVLMMEALLVIWYTDICSLLWSDIINSIGIVFFVALGFWCCWKYALSEIWKSYRKEKNGK